MENETNHQSMQGAAVGIVLVSCDDRTSSRAFAPLVPLNFQNIRHTDSHERTTPVSVQYIRDRFTLQNIHDREDSAREKDQKHYTSQAWRTSTS